MNINNSFMTMSSTPNIFSKCSMSEDNGENQSYKCEICGKTYNSKIYLKDHLTIHSDVRAYECNVCCKRFRFGSNLSEHRTVHMVDNLFFKCTECNHAVRLRGNLKKHMKTHFKDGFALDIVWRKLRESGTLDVNRNLRQAMEKGDRRNRNSLNSNFLKEMKMEYKPPPTLSNSFAFGESTDPMPEICPPTLLKNTEALRNMSSNSLTVGKLKEKNVLSDNGPPPLISVTEAQRLALMKKNGEDITELKIAKFEKFIEENALNAVSMESFFARLDNIPYEEVVCPFCATKFSCFGECEEHIFVSHDKPHDSFGHELFCNVCLKLFENFESFTLHQNYHNLVQDMLNNNTLNVRTRLAEFKKAQTEKFVCIS